MQRRWRKRWLTMDDAHTKVGEEVLHYFKTDPETGLDDDQLRRYQEKYGPNGEYYLPLY